MEHHISQLTLRIAERAQGLAQRRQVPPGGELALWLEAEAEVKRELRERRERASARAGNAGSRSAAA